MLTAVNAIPASSIPVRGAIALRPTGARPLPRPATLAPLADRARRIALDRDATLFSEGDDASRIYEVTSGIVRLTKTLADGRRQVLDFVDSGRFIGLHEDALHGATAEAVTPVTVICYESAGVARAVAEDAATAQRLLAELLGAAARAESRLVVVGRMTAEERVASFLLARAGDEAADGDVFKLQMGRADIADYLALTVETVSRTLSRFKAQGLVAMTDAHSIELTDVDALRDLASM
ncbi:MAG: helix-turn-helix domain-containing protein [Alphaproteobacteria bacterium]|nr:helix-turn-helix domain-containing protein [Alphaproteobacteria bacterium]